MQLNELTIVSMLGRYCIISAAEKGDYYERGWPDSVAEREVFWPNEGYIVRQTRS